MTHVFIRAATGGRAAASEKQRQQTHIQTQTDRQTDRQTDGPAGGRWRRLVAEDRPAALKFTLSQLVCFLASWTDQCVWPVCLASVSPWRFFSRLNDAPGPAPRGSLGPSLKHHQPPCRRANFQETPLLYENSRKLHILAA